MIRILFGSDTFSRRERLVSLKRSLDGDGMLESNTAVFDGSSVTADELRAHCSTIPFLAATRLVIVEGLLKRAERRGGGRGARGRAQGAAAAGDDDADAGAAPGSDGLPAWRWLREFPEEMPATTELVLLDDDVADSNQLLRDLKPVVHWERFEPPGRNDLPGWIFDRAAVKGLHLTQRQSAWLAEVVGPDLWILDNELEKLAVFASPGNAISDQEAETLVVAARQQSIFVLSDHIAEGRRGPALLSVRKLLTDGVSPQQILTMIGRQFRLLALARDAMDSRVPPGQVMERLDTRSQFVVDKTMKQARRFTLPLIRRCYKRIVQADFDTKTGVYDAEVALELLVGDLAGAAPR